MILHYAIFIILISVLLIAFSKLINKIIVTKKSEYSNCFIIKGQQCNCYTIFGLIFSVFCFCNVIITTGLVISYMNILRTLGLNLNLVDLLIPNKYYLFLDTITHNFRMEIPLIVNGQKALFSLFYTCIYFLIGVYFLIANSRAIYIKNTGIYILDKTYKWNPNKLPRQKKIFGKIIFEAYVLDTNGNSKVLNIILNKGDEMILENLIDAERNIDNKV